MKKENVRLTSAMGLAALMGWLILLTVPAFAQSVRGALAGTVMDTSGAAIPGANIVATNTATGERRTTTSTSSGTYRLPEMPIGAYDLSVKAPGFKAGIYSDITVTINSTSAVNVQLNVGASTQTVTVNANALALQTETSDVSGNVSTKQIIQLPLALGGMGGLRSPEAFAFLLPGVTGPGTASALAGNNVGGIHLLRIGGGQASSDEVLLDGSSQNRQDNGATFDEEAPSVEALQEFKVTTSVPEAEFGRSTGGVISFSTKSGTNSYHGSAFDIVRNDVLDANTWFNNGRRATLCVGAGNTPACRALYKRPSDKQNDYGVSLGGFVRIPHLYNGKDKTFFFFSWEQFRRNVGVSITSMVPTALERTGDFSQFLQANNPVGTNPCDGKTVYFGEIFDPMTTRTVGGVPCRSAFPGNAIPLARMSGAAQKLLAYYPDPTNSGLANNYTLTSIKPIVDTTTTIRIDESLNNANKIFFSLSSRENAQLAGNNQQLPLLVDSATWSQDFHAHLARFGWDYVLSPRLLNHLQLGTNRVNVRNLSHAALGSTNYSQEVGIGNVDSNMFPITVIGEGIDTLGNGSNNVQYVNSLLLADSVNWEKGANSFKFGIDLRYFQFSSIFVNQPVFNYARGETAAANLPTILQSSGNGLASFMLGQVNSSSLKVYAHNPRLSHNYYAGFVQDDLKASKTLTLNLDLRYDVETPHWEAYDSYSNFSPTAVDPPYGVPGALVFASQCRCRGSAWPQTWFKNFGPRIGFAWAPAFFQGKTVFRGASGILYGPLQYFDSAGGGIAGYSITSSPASSDNFTEAFGLENGFPAFAPPPDLNPGYFNGQPIVSNYIEPRPARTATVYQWNMQVQQQISADTIFTLGYMGMDSTNLSSSLQNINNIPVADFSLGNQLAAPIATNTAGVKPPFAGFTTLWKGGTVQQALRPFPQYGNINSGCCLQNLGHATYNALIASIHKQFRNGLEYMVSYTWSKDITNSDNSQANNGGLNPGEQQIQNPLNLRGEKSLSIQDVPNNLAFSYLYALPFGRGQRFLNHRNAFVDEILGGWQIGGVQRYVSGLPISFGCASSIPGWDNCVKFSFTGGPIKSAAAQRHTVNPFLTASGSNPNVNSLFNGSTFGSQTASVQANPAFFDQNNPQFRGTGAYGFGNVSRVTGAVRMNPYLNEDFSLWKTFPIREQVSFALKFEALNALNRHSWALPDETPSDLLFGVPVNTIAGPRYMQIAGRITF